MKKFLCTPFALANHFAHFHTLDYHAITIHLLRFCVFALLHAKKCMGSTPQYIIIIKYLIIK